MRPEWMRLVQPVAALTIAFGGCRESELGRRDAEKRMLTAVAATRAAEATPVPPEAANPGGESEATYEFAVPPERPTEVREYRPPEERPSDSPRTCITASAAPTMTQAYGRGGEVIHLSVRAYNACATNFGSVTFRVFAIGPDGGEVGSATGRISGLSAGNSAETFVVIPAKPSLSLIYRAEITSY